MLQSWTQLKEVYAHVDDVDLYVGGYMEDLLPGTLVGPVFQCIIAEQFRRWRVGDKYFYEFGGYPGSFRLGNLMIHLFLNRITRTCSISHHVPLSLQDLT